MLSVMAHLTSLVFVVWSLHCLFAGFERAPGGFRRLLVWAYLAGLVWVFFEMR